MELSEKPSKSLMESIDNLSSLVGALQIRLTKDSLTRKEKTEFVNMYDTHHMGETSVMSNSKG